MVLNIILTVLSVALLLVSGWIGIKKKIRDEAEGVINEAEDTELKGSQKMQYAVERIEAILPAAIRPIVSRDTIESGLQIVFDGMEKFAKKQAAKNGEIK